MNIVELAVQELGVKEGCLRHQHYIDVYASQETVPRKYVPSLHDAWCALFVSYLLLQAHENVFCTEVSCYYMSEKYREKEKLILATLKPKVGYTIFYSLGGKRLDHVGVISAINGDYLTVIEGNKSDSVSTRVISRHDNRIKYYGINTVVSTTYPKPKTTREIAYEVIRGRWGNGADRIELLTNRGYDYGVVQKEVNRILDEWEQ